MKRFINISKGILNYIFAMIFAIIFALFLNANVGWFLLLALILAPLLSILFAWLSSLLITVSMEMKEDILSKGDSCCMTVHIKNPSIFPTPPIDITLTHEPGVRSSNPHIIASAISRSTQSFSVNFTAYICGESNVGIHKIRVTDYLGLFSFAPRKVNCEELQQGMAVIPNIAEISARDDTLLKTMQASLHSESSDDTNESSTLSFGGLPGYNHRDYVPGDPLKRINWKQSARKNKLLVRLDDEMASQAINVVLDSVFEQDDLDISELLTYAQFNDCTPENILPKVAEAAVENALGVLYVLLRHNYTINFYVNLGQGFDKYEIQDEMSLENLRLDLAHYSYSPYPEAERFPLEDLLQSKSAVSLFSTPGSYVNAHNILSTYSENMYTTIYSVVEEAKKRIVPANELLSKNTILLEKPSFLSKAKDMVRHLWVPFLLALVSSINVFYAFKVPIFSYWTLLQIIVSIGIFALCDFVKKHRFIGGLIVTILVMAILYIYLRIIFSKDWGRTYMYWFMSGGESIETTFTYLFSLLMVFTVFFSMVIYYFTQILYRTSFLMLVSLIPFVVHVKLMHKIDVSYAVIAVALNILAFLFHNRIKKDKEKRIVGYIPGIISLGLYTLLFLLIGLTVPKNENTPYYYVFENLFLGGNVSTLLPEEYSAMSEHSGNADNFEELNDRKLYEIRSVDMGPVLYLTRQTFDYYDFKRDYWYSFDTQKQPGISPPDWQEKRENLNLTYLALGIQTAEELSPGFREKYGLEQIPQYFNQSDDTIYITTTNFPSVAYITPPGTYCVSVPGSDEKMDFLHTGVSRGGIYQRKESFLNANLEYEVTYYEINNTAASWASFGGCDHSLEESIAMLSELTEILSNSTHKKYAEVASSYLQDALDAYSYGQLCNSNNSAIPPKVRELALEITADCSNDWEKALALQTYFEENKFVYDLSYDAPDDSVEYFLFEGKTGTCSDYASAYVLLARSAGLTCRYAEGFVPNAEYSGDYIVRTDCGHAYPEVYIPNVGYVVFEATKPAIYRVSPSSNRRGSGITSYLMVVGYRTLLIFAGVSAAIILILFIHLCLRPVVSELLFRHRIRHAAPGQAVLLIYQRILAKLTHNTIRDASCLTPNEYRLRFLRRYHYDMKDLILLVENAAYTEASLSSEAKADALAEYQRLRELLKKNKK